MREHYEIDPSQDGRDEIRKALSNGGYAFFDIDGTLKEHGQGMPENLAASMQQLGLHSVTVGLCSARSPAQLEQFFAEVYDLYHVDPRTLFPGWILLEDSHVIIEPGQQIASAQVLTSENALQQMHLFEARFKQEWRQAEEFPQWGRLQGLPVPNVRWLRHPNLGTGCFEEQGTYDDPNYLLAMQWTLAVAQELQLDALDFMEVGEGAVRILQKGINKGSGLQTLANKGLVDLRKTLYVGDGNNDVFAAQTVLAGGGVAAAVSNATQAMKNAVKYVTPESGPFGVMGLNQVICK